MRAHVLVNPGELELREIPIPTPDEGEVVVRIRTALTCGTDLKTFSRGHPRWQMPMMFGHEFSGEIAAVGKGVSEWREGDLIMSAPTGPCGECFYCQREEENLCDTIMSTMVHGAYSDYIKLPWRIVRSNLYRKPASLPFSTAALLEPLACVLHGLANVRLHDEDTVVLIGAGAISLLHLLALEAMGARRIIVVGRSPERARHAARLGAAEVITEPMDIARQRVVELTHGRGADLVIECTGQVEIWEAAVGFARRGGQLIFFGGCKAGTEVRIETQRFHYEELRLSSPFHFTPRSVRRSYEMITGGNFKGEMLISASYPLTQLAEALEQHRSGRAIKVAVVPEP